MVANEVRTADYLARGATLADAPAILTVLQAAFPRWPSIELAGSALEHLEWKLSAPSVTPEMHTVVTCNGAIAAAQIAWSAPATLEGSPEPVGLTVDLAVHPDHQGRGLTRFMTEERHADPGVVPMIGMDLVSKSEAVRHIWGDEDGTVRRWMQAWARPTTLRAAVGQLRRGGPRAFVPGIARTLGVAGGAFQRPPADISIEELEGFDQRADTLWSVVSARAGFTWSRTRDAAYLNWRHADPRSGARTILGARIDGELVAWAVLRPDHGALRLADFLVHPDHRDAGLALLDRCAREASDLCAGALLTWLPEGHPTEDLLRIAGFARSGDRFICEFWVSIARGMSPELIAPLASPAAPLHITMADFDFA